MSGTTTDMAEMYDATTAVMDELTTSNWNSTKEVPVPIPVLASELLSYKVAAATHVYWLPVIAFVGLAGNIISFIIMLKPHNRRISCCNYMAALAITDSFILLTAVDYWTVSFESRPNYNTECRIMAWLLQASCFSSMILIFSMTVDRFAAIRFPFRARTICTTYRTRVAIGCILVSTHVYTLPYLFTSGNLPNSRTCVAVLTSDKLSVVYNWVNIFLGSFVPFVGLLAMNTAIIVTIRTRGKYFHKSAVEATPSRKEVQNKGIESDETTSTTDFNDIATAPDANGTNPKSSTLNTAKPSNPSKPSLPKGSQKASGSKEDSSSRDNQLTVMLLLVTFTFLLLTLPQYVRYAISAFWDYTQTAEDFADYILTAHVTNRLFNTNSACNFFLYCLSGTRFRQDLVSLFRRNK